jgi:hypothetical protein
MITKLVAHVAFLALSVTTPIANAQVMFAHYDVNDELSGIKRAEIWLSTRTKKPDVYLSTKVLTSTKENIETETIDPSDYYWLRKVQLWDENTYHEEFLASPPNTVTPGETTYGFINHRDSTTHRIIGSWPLFLKVEELGVSRRAIFTTYLPNNVVKEVTRIFIEGGYFFPITEETKIYKPGVITSLVPKNIAPSRFLNVYTIAVRKD